ncbi:DUF4244 domain-containing protein [Kribbella shirazensis]|uniref:DUF4244 domain-containing protein n=1 Tax=Kribbella shirazensis TaxID=1105143 RepID=A0A7X5ZZA4_9ACTN|nr:DUF4244 domain-containing protein [Kribbella shirazensis]NIK54889.1 hypothetical protein [Kribbella shirazensis]
MPQAATATSNHPTNPPSTHSANAANPHNHKPANNSDRAPEHTAPDPSHPDTAAPNDGHPLIANPHIASAPARRQAPTRATTHRHAPTNRALSHLRTRTERGAATAEYAITIVGACAIGGLLVSLLKSPAMQNALKSIINYGLKMAGVEGVHL